MQDLEKIKEAAENLPKEVKAQALSLLEKMSSVIEGIGDKPIEHRPENLRVVQPTSDRSKLPKGTNIGDVVIGETVAKLPLKVIPLRIWDSRQMWSPDKDEARVLCSSPDAVLGYIGKYCKECEFSKFNVEENKSACNRGKTVLFITADLSTIVTVNFTKTNYSNGKDWETLMKKAGVAPFKRIYELKTETNKKFKNVESLVVNTQNERTPESYVPFLESLFTKVGEDRDNHRKKFYEIVQAKQQAQNVSLLEAPSEDNILPAPAAEATSSQSDMSKKYSL